MPSNPDLPKSRRVIAAFPATGKSWLAAQHSQIEDSDSSSFSRGPEWPQNYIDRIRRLSDLGATVFVSTHAEVRSALVEGWIPFTLVYPDVSLREEYRARMQRRGSSPALIHKVIDELWDDALADCAEQAGCDHVVLGPGQYLADVAAFSTEADHG